MATSDGAGTPLAYADAEFLEINTGRTVCAVLREFVGTVEPASGLVPTCVLIHGNPACLLDWVGVGEPLRQAANVVAIDLPGFGRSERVGGDESIDLEHMAADVMAVVAALPWDGPVFLVGHSHGGGVAQLAAANYPEKVAGIVLLGTLGTPLHLSYRLLGLPGVRAFMGGLGWALRSRPMRGLNRIIVGITLRDIYRPGRVSETLVDRQLSELVERPEILLSMVDVTRGAPCEVVARAGARIRCPAVFIHGGEDALVSAAHARNAHENILAAGGRSTFIELPAAGHMLMQQQGSMVVEEIRRLVCDELERLSGSPGT